MLENHTEVEKGLWDAGDELRANSKLGALESSVPVLGSMFLRYSDQGKDQSREFKIQELTSIAMTLVDWATRRRIDEFASLYFAQSDEGEFGNPSMENR